MSSNVPAAREMLHIQIDLLKAALAPGATGPQMREAITGAISAARLALPMMTRDRVKPVTAAITHCRLTPEIAAEIRAHVRRNPAASCKDVGELFNVNAGRVSEALAFKE